MTSQRFGHPLPLPPHFAPERAGEIWRVPYGERAAGAAAWAAAHAIPPAADDAPRVCLVLVDMQNTFCQPGFELYVGGRSGTGAVDDSQRTAAFIYRNLAHLTQIAATFDTHQAMQIFHPIHLIDAQGEHPAPLTIVTAEDVASGRWRFNPAAAASLGITPAYGQAQLLDYTQRLKAERKYDLTIWPYHAMLGGIGHALVPLIEEAVFFHTVARASQFDPQLKGSYPLTESYSAIGPEVVQDHLGARIGQKNAAFLRRLEQFDAIIVAGEAKSHCVAWTVADLLAALQARDPALARKLYLLEDCTSPVVVPGVVDYTEAADAAFARFAAAGAHLVRSTEPMARWPGLE
jgi:nicotinamidase-related amidase